MYLKNGAMYSVLVLGFVMLAHAYGIHVPEWPAPVATILIVGYFFVEAWYHADCGSLNVRGVPGLKRFFGGGCS